MAPNQVGRLSDKHTSGRASTHSSSLLWDNAGQGLLLEVREGAFWACLVLPAHGVDLAVSCLFDFTGGKAAGGQGLQAHGEGASGQPGQATDGE